MKKKRILRAVILMAFIACIGFSAAPAQAASKPARATLTSVACNTGRTLTVKWKKVSGASGYEVDLATDQSFTFSRDTVKVSGGTKTSKTITEKNLWWEEFKTGKRYYVRVRAYKQSGKKTLYGSWSKSSSCVVKDKATKPKKTAITALKKGYATYVSGNRQPNSTGFTVKYKAAKFPAGYGASYQVQYSTSSKFTKKTTKTVKWTETSYTKTGLKGGKYYVRVRAYVKDGKKTLYAPWSKAKAITVPKSSNNATVKAEYTAPGTVKITPSLKPTSAYSAQTIEIALDKTFDKLCWYDNVGVGDKQSSMSMDPYSYKKIDIFLKGTYYVRTRYVGKKNGKVINSSWSKPVKVVVKEDAKFYKNYKDLLPKIGIKPGMSDWEKAEIITCHVNDSVRSKMPAIGVRMSTFCVGRAAYRWILYEAAGLEAYVVSGYWNGGTHAWNLVKLDGDWYYTDGWTDKENQAISKRITLMPCKVPILPDSYSFTDPRISRSTKLQPGNARWDVTFSNSGGQTTADGWDGENCSGFNFDWDPVGKLVKDEFDNYYHWE